VVHQTFLRKHPLGFIVGSQDSQTDNRNGPKVNVRILFGISMSGLWLKIIGTAIWFYQEYIIGLEFRIVSVYIYMSVDTIWWYSYTHICMNTYLLIYICILKSIIFLLLLSLQCRPIFFQPALPFGYVGSCRSTGGNSKQTLRPVSVRFVENHPCDSNMYSYCICILGICSQDQKPQNWCLIYWISVTHLDPK